MGGGKLRWILVGVALALIGFVFLRGPTPEIKIKPETLFEASGVSFTNTLITSWIVVGLIVLLVFLATRRWEMVPRGVQNLVEAVIEAFYGLVVKVAGEKNGRRFFPVVATLFFFILFANWFSLMPLFHVVGLAKEEIPVSESQVAAEGEVASKEVHAETQGAFFVLDRFDAGPIPVAWATPSSPSSLQGQTVERDSPEVVEEVKGAQAEGKFVGEILPFLRGINTDLNTTLALAIVSAIAVQYWAISSLGVGSYITKFLNFGGFFRGLRRLSFAKIFQGAIDAFVGILELISELVRLVSFTFRLFGNMFAGEVVILMFTFLAPLVLTVVMYGLEVFVGIIQAFIFALLTLVFGVMAVAHGEAHKPSESRPRGATGKGSDQSGPGVGSLPEGKLG